MSLPATYYQDDSATIYHGDCMEILPSVGAVDSVITDPPYGINTKSDGGGKINPWADLCNASFWYAAWMAKCRDKIAGGGSMWAFLNWRSMVTYQKASCDMGWPIASMLVWDKEWIGPSMEGLRPRYEMVSVFLEGGFKIKNRGLHDIQRFKWSSHKPSGHPAEKPATLMRWIIEASGAHLVLDPFAGSGTTGVAAKQLGKKSILIEQDERYCEIAAKRMSQEVLL